MRRGAAGQRESKCEAYRLPSWVIPEIPHDLETSNGERMGWVPTWRPIRARFSCPCPRPSSILFACRNVLVSPMWLLQGYAISSTLFHVCAAWLGVVGRGNTV